MAHAMLVGDKIIESRKCYLELGWYVLGVGSKDSKQVAALKPFISAIDGLDYGPAMADEIAKYKGCLVGMIYISRSLPVDYFNGCNCARSPGSCGIHLLPPYEGCLHTPREPLGVDTRSQVIGARVQLGDRADLSRHHAWFQADRAAEVHV